MAADSTPATAPSALLLTLRQAAQSLNLCEKTVWNLTAPRGPIRAVRSGRALRYDPRDLVAWIDAQKEGGGR